MAKRVVTRHKKVFKYVYRYPLLGRHVSRVETRVKVYQRLEDLPEVLEPGKYIVEGKELEVLEPVGRGTVEELIKLTKERKGHKFI